MAKIFITGKVKQCLQRKGDKSVYYIYQFEVSKNDGYLEIVDVYIKEKFPFKEDEEITIPLTVSVRDNQIFYEFNTLDNKNG